MADCSIIDKHYFFIVSIIIYPFFVAIYTFSTNCISIFSLVNPFTNLRSAYISSIHYSYGFPVHKKIVTICTISMWFTLHCFSAFLHLFNSIWNKFMPFNFVAKIIFEYESSVLTRKKDFALIVSLSLDFLFFFTSSLWGIFCRAATKISWSIDFLQSSSLLQSSEKIITLN